MFENRVLRKIFGPKKEKVKGGWKKMRNEEICCMQAEHVAFTVYM
jgi:hypothetical protein